MDRYKVPGYIIRHPDITPYAKVIYAVLHRLATKGKGSDNRECWPSNEWLSQETHIKLTKIKSAIAELVKHDLISYPPDDKRPRKKDGTFGRRIITVHSQPRLPYPPTTPY